MHSFLTLNIQNPSVDRAKLQTEWLLSQNCDVIGLTETKTSTGCRELQEILTHEGYACHLSRCLPNDYGVMLAVKKDINHQILQLPTDVRMGGVNLNDWDMNLVLCYSPSSDRRPDKLQKKKEFLEKVLGVANDENFQKRTLIFGDFNIISRSHEPKSTMFQKFEYDFYDGILDAGYVDLFERLNPGVVDYSWFGRTGKGYRYDYCFVSEGVCSIFGSCSLNHGTREIKLSDHSALICRS